MKRTSLHSLEPSSARKKIASAKSNKPFMAALLDRGHRGHKEAVEQWTRLHEAAFPEPTSSTVFGPRKTGGGAFANTGAMSARRDGRASEGDNFALSRKLLRPTKSRLQDIVGAGDRRISGTASESLGESEPPVVNLEPDRIQVLIEDAPARFEIAENPDANPNYGKWHTIHALGVIAVRLNEAIIEREAEAQGVDPDLVKAILYVERAQGYRDIPAEILGRAESLHPMNIRPDPWSALDNPPADLGDQETNIRIAVTLIRRISERIDDPTPAKVASIWNFTGRERVNHYGARVQDVYQNRTWDFEHDPTEMP